MDTDTQSNNNNRMLPIVYTLAALGLPMAGAAFSDNFFALLTEDPVRAVALALLYSIVVVAFGFVSKVWQQVEGTLVDRAVKWVEDQYSTHLSGRRQRYLQHLTYLHRDFDVKGLSTQGIFTLMLEEVFVALRIVPQAPHLTSPDPLRVRHEPSNANHIWRFLAAETVTEQNFAIIGPPGSGKTTLLKYVTLMMTDRSKRVPQGGALTRSVPKGFGDKLPILLFLRDIASNIHTDPNYALSQAIHHALVTSKMPNPPAASWFERFLKRGQCLVMLDGLDEVADAQLRREVALWVEQQMDAYGNNRFLITSRPFGYRSNPLAGVTVLEVQPFDSHQVQRFIERWYVANEIKSFQQDDAGVRLKAQAGADDLVQRVRNSSSLSALAVNPLLLTMIATVHRYRSSLPERRVELYAEISDAFLGKRQQARGLAFKLTPAQKQNVLEPLAYHMMQQQQREIPLATALEVIQMPLELVSPEQEGRDFLDMVENSSGLLLEREVDIYAFAHLTFQEFFAAMHILENPSLAQELTMYVEDSWWHETIRLYCARADATPIIEACLSQPKPSVAALTLAIECSREALKIQPHVRRQLTTILEEGIEDEDPERRKIISEALLALHLRQMRRVNTHLYVATSLVTAGIYQLFLDEQITRGAVFHPDHWQKPTFPAGQGSQPVVGVCPLDAIDFCQWLTDRDVERWYYRLPITGEFAAIGERAAGYWSRHETLQQFVVEEAPAIGLTLPALKNRLRSDYARSEEVNRDQNLDRRLERTLQLASDLAVEERLENDDLNYSSRGLHFSLARALDLDVTVDRASELDRDRNRVLAHCLEGEVPPKLESVVTQLLSLDLAFVLDRAIARSASNNPDSPRIAAYWRWYARFVTWIITESLLEILRLQQLNRSVLNIFDPARRQEVREEEVRSLAEEYFELYLDLAVLEERSDGRLAAFEGIRLVKEKVGVRAHDAI